MSQFVPSQPEKTEGSCDEEEMEGRGAASRCFKGKNVRGAPFKRSIEHECVKWSYMVHKVRDCTAGEKDVEG
jgi:hypothetical protein